MNLIRSNILVLICMCIAMPINIFAAESSEDLFPTQTGIVGTVSAVNVNIRTGPDLVSKSVGYASNEQVMILGEYDDWYKINYEDQELWIYSDYVDVSYSEFIPKASRLGELIVEYGKKFMGVPYVWGGNSLTCGVDCSGFTQKIYDEFNIDIDRVSYMQANNGSTISKEELRAGDLVFFDTSGVNNGNISHVGVYIGDREFIHSAASKGISIASLDNDYYKQNYVKSIRIPGV